MEQDGVGQNTIIGVSLLEVNAFKQLLEVLGRS